MRRPTSKPPVTRLRSPSRSSTYKTSSKQNNGAAALEDERFKQFLKNADEIESIEHFMYWKDEFFRTFRPYLDPLGTATAREADEELYFELEKLANACVHTNELVKEGKISPEKSSVKGQKSINEMIASTCTCEQHIDRYFPKTQEEELTCGYSKFELAAVLVRDGFRVYGMMVATRNYVQGLVIEGGALQKILKSNQMSILQYYFRCLDTFAQTMADLGMFKLMVRCEELYSVRPRRKKSKTKKFNKHGAKDALSDTSCEGEAINGGRMFQKSKLNYRAIMDKGWSNGLCLGQEILGPLKFSKKNDKKKKKGGKKKKRLIKENNKDANCKSGEDNEVASNDETNFSPEAGSSSSIEDDSVDETAETVDELMSMASSSEDEEEDEEDVIYYFDPVRKIVGKVSRKKCLAENTIVSVDSETGTERAEGVVEEWDSRDDEIGKQDLILKLKEILRSKA